MRIQTNIFLWGFFAFVVPLTALALIATHYSQAQYLDDVQKDVRQNMLGLTDEVERRLAADRSLTYGLSVTPAIQRFLPVLDQLSNQKVPINFEQQRELLNRFFEGFQTIIPSNFFIRVLDTDGNTLIKVSHNQRSQAVFESLNGFSYVEQELQDPVFVSALKSLPKSDVSAMVLPHNKYQSDLLSNLSLLDNIIPLYYKNKWVGAICLTVMGEGIDKILNHHIRPYSGSLIIIETTVDAKNRHGLILFDDDNKLLFSHLTSTQKFIQKTPLNVLLEKTFDSEISVHSSNQMDSMTHYIEMTPYPNQFVNWIMALSIPNTIINQPYSEIRTNIWMIAGLTLMIGLLLTQIGARRVTQALSSLVLNFKNYAQGDQNQVAVTKHCMKEIKDLGEAFNDMIATLNKAHAERDTAQHMMLQSNKLASIGQMAAGIGHEINNPLNNILSYAKLVTRNINSTSMDTPSKESLLADINALREETLRASDIVKGIMNFARQVPPNITDFDTKTWLDNSIALVQQSASNKSILIETHLELPNNPILKGDRNQLQQVLVNLLLNAIHASPKKSSVKVNVSVTTKHLNIDIIDSGSGIEPHILNSIFDPFFTTKQQGQGTGLGLSISLGIIEHHQGTLEIHNNDNNIGVIAKIALPILL